MPSPSWTRWTIEVPRQVLILESAKAEFRLLKSRVKREFGEFAWANVNAEFKSALQLIRDNPEIGLELEELKALGVPSFRSKLVQQTRVVYEFDDYKVLVHMFIHTRRDFAAHLRQRVLNV